MAKRSVTITGMTAEDDRVAAVVESRAVFAKQGEYSNLYHFLFPGYTLVAQSFSIQVFTALALSPVLLSPVVRVMVDLRQ